MVFLFSIFQQIVSAKSEAKKKQHEHKHRHTLAYKQEMQKKRSSERASKRTSPKRAKPFTEIIASTLNACVRERESVFFSAAFFFLLVDVLVTVGG